MSTKQKSQRGFVAVTLITVLAIALVIVVYATILGTFQGGNVEVVALNGNLWYNKDNSTTWYTDLSGVGNGTSWYVMFNTSSTGPVQTVNIIWQLQNNTGTWEDVSGATVNTNNFGLNGDAGQEIFASTDGLQTGNTDWGTYTPTAGTYRIKMTIQTA